MTNRDNLNLNDQVGGYRFSGHQTFALRIAWLPKAVAAIEDGRDVLTNPLQGVVELGLGKNMVEALRCWVEAYGVARRTSDGWQLTDEAAVIFARQGTDPYLEDPQTLWWLHWKISSLRTAPFFAWELLVNRWNDPTFTSSAAIHEFARQAEREGRGLSEITLKQHIDVWLRTYSSPRGVRAMEDGLDSPLAALGFVRPSGERETVGRREPVFAFDLGLKRSISLPLFRYALLDWWGAEARDGTAAFHEVAHGPGSPGRVFRLPEADVRDRLRALSDDPRSGFELHESLNQYQVRRRGPAPSLSTALLAAYRRAPIRTKGAASG
ncbi:DUF4007 family protein [Mesorhizobium sp.]|uniref:DUF4007 family protein n=1 Tax=Mesorhizobium sp. TaxID=1871066 RepID=UPI0011F7066F|nr:DUF4007 family protein [Mesorhizobium sp.]TIL65601.1 MAG: DUF4007 family protein [Mesorhizobium sp.]